MVRVCMGARDEKMMCLSHLRREKKMTSRADQIKVLCVCIYNVKKTARSPGCLSSSSNLMVCFTIHLLQTSFLLVRALFLSLFVQLNAFCVMAHAKFAYGNLTDMIFSPHQTSGRKVMDVFFSRFCPLHFTFLHCLKTVDLNLSCDFIAAHIALNLFNQQY
jgi:hypothetical protein